MVRDLTANGVAHDQVVPLLCSMDNGKPYPRLLHNVYYAGFERDIAVADTHGYAEDWQNIRIVKIKKVHVHLYESVNSQ